MLRRAVTSGIFCALALLACAARVEACSCVGPGSACAAFGAAEAVFVGTVSEVVRGRRDGGEKAGGWERPVARFVVEEAFAGVEGAEVSVEGGSGADCGYDFTAGRRYLVYAGRTKEGGLYASLCSRTQPARESAEDIAFLRGLAGQPAGGTIAGAVVKPLDETDERGVRKEAAVEGARVTVAGRGGLREAAIDARGRYRLSGLPPDRYEVMVHLRAGLTVKEPRRRVEVAERGCAAADFYVMDDGRVSGRVLDADGRAVPNVAVTLVDAEGKSSVLRYDRHAKADAEGLYKFSALPPGRYLLGVRLSPPSSPDDPAAEFPRTYYPGVARAAEAEILELKAGEELTLPDLRLPPRMAEAVIRVRVVWGDGTPAAGAGVQYRETTYEDAAAYETRPADGQGQFEIKTRVGAVFQIQAAALLPRPGDPPGTGLLVRSEPRTSSATIPGETVTLVIPKPK